MNIEKTISEQAVSDILTPMLESQDRIVTEDVAPLFDQATGLDTPPASGSVTTTIEESRSVITAIIRKAWTATLTMLCGASVIGYITAAYTYLRTRLQGNETYGIPDRRSEISASSPLAANLALLNDRKISEPNAIEGISLAQILGGAYKPASIEDNTKGWALVKPILGTFQDVKLGCKTIELASVDYSTPAVVNVTGAVSFDELETCRSRCLLNGGSGDTLVFHKLTSFRAQTAYVAAISGCNYKRLIFPVLTDYRDGNHYYGNSTGLVLNSPGVEYIECDVLPQTNGSGNVNLFYNNASLEEINLPGFTNHNISIMRNCPELTTLRLGKITAWSVPSRGDWDAEYDEFKKETKLILIEFGQGSAANINLGNWSPTLDSSNLQQFLSNFRDYIADKLQGGYPIGQGPILTLSQAVRNAIHAAESTYGIEAIIVTQKGWTLSPAPTA